MGDDTKEELQTQEILPYLKDLQMEDCEEYVLTVQALTNFLLELQLGGKLTEDDIVFISYLTSQMRINIINHLKNKIGEVMIDSIKKAMYINP